MKWPLGSDPEQWDLIMTLYQTPAVTPCPLLAIVDGAGGDQYPDKLHAKKETPG